MSDHYNLRPRPTVTATEGMDVEQAPEGPGHGPAPTQVEEGWALVHTTHTTVLRLCGICPGKPG